ncbi:MAG: hypothetical protein U0528_09205 [Anaerolineae bacterium]
MDGLELVPVAEAPLASADVVFLALPHGVAGQVAAQAVEQGVHVIDLSADLRLDTPELYKQVYKHDHPPAPHLLPCPLVYLTNRHKLYNAHIANPRRYVTTVLLAYPLSVLNGVTDC